MGAPVAPAAWHRAPGWGQQGAGENIQWARGDGPSNPALGAAHGLGADRARLSKAGAPGGLLQLAAKFVALLVDRRNHRAGWQAQAHERGLRELQACLDGFRYGIG